MTIEALTDDQIESLVKMPKRVTNPNAKKVIKPGHWQKNYALDVTDGKYRFVIYVRQNTEIEVDFSVGLRLELHGSEPLTLVRYNGSSHRHPNKIEKTVIDHQCHIHRATERYIASGKKPDGFAELNTNYRTVYGALHCLVHDCSVENLMTSPDGPEQPILI